MPGWQKRVATEAASAMPILLFAFLGRDLGGLLNSHRRHLSPSQSAAIVMKHTEMLEGAGRPKQNLIGSRDPIKTR